MLARFIALCRAINEYPVTISAALWVMPYALVQQDVYLAHVCQFL
jgi:hypothetical protein